MPRKTAVNNEDLDLEEVDLLPTIPTLEQNEDEVAKLNRLLAAVMNYLSDEEIEEIDIEYLLRNTDGLREWWDNYRENNRKEIEEEIKQSLGELTLEELESIREKIKGKDK